MNAPITLNITRNGNQYHVKGKYFAPIDAFSFEKEPTTIEKTLANLPATINTRIGNIYFTPNKRYKMEDGDELVLNDQDPQRGLDYLHTLVKVYNRQANFDKNEIAYRTEQFINSRLEKINAELGSTEGQLESYKKRNKMVEMKLNATAAIANADTYAQKLQEANTQVELLKELGKYMNEPGNKYQPIPAVALSQRELSYCNSIDSTVGRPR